MKKRNLPLGVFRLSIFMCLMFLVDVGLFAQSNSLTVNGRVLDAQTREPLIGVTVMEKGTENAVVTDFDGNYTIKVSQGATISFSYISYAEVLLSYAEALYEYNGNITDAQLDMTVNAVRERAGFDAKLSNSFASANGLNILDEIRRERLVEFIDEGLRYNDIIRWKIAEKVLPVDILGLKYSETDTSTKREDIQARLTSEGGMFKGKKVTDQADIYVIEEASTRNFNPDRDYYYPIPTYEIATSDGNVVQNPGWN